MSGSRLGQISCETVSIIDDSITEPTENFTLEIKPRDEDTILLNSTLVVTIKDNEGIIYKLNALF